MRIPSVHVRFAIRLWVPLLLWVGFAKVHRVSTGTGYGLVRSIAACLPDLCLYGGLGLLTVGLLSVPHRPARVAVVFGAIGLVVLGTFIEVVGWTFFVSTGSWIDAPLLHYAVPRVHLLWSVLASEITAIPVAAVIGGVSWAGLTLAARPLSAPVGTWTDFGRAQLVVLAGGVGLVLVSALPTPSRYGALMRPIPLELAVSTTKGLPPPRVTDPGSWNRAEIRRVAESPVRNVVVVWLESTGWQATSLGGPYATTPFLADLARDSLVATDAWSVVPHSTKSAVSIFCGVPARPAMEVSEGRPGGVPARCLPHLLRDQGFTSIMLRSGTREFEGWTQLLDNVGFDRLLSWEDMDTTGQEVVNYFGYEDDILLEAGRAQIEANRGRPLLLAYMTNTTHHNYGLPSDFAREPFDPDRPLHDSYLNAVRYVDGFLERLFAQHRALGIYDETLYVVVGDHGEGFDEHRRKQHDAVPWDEVLHVPLLVHLPGRFEGGVRVDAPTSQLDVVPTVLDLLGFALDAPDRDGVSLVGPVPDRPLHSWCWYALRCGTIRRGSTVVVSHLGAQGREVYDGRWTPADRPAAEVDALERALLQWASDVDVRYR